LGQTVAAQRAEHVLAVLKQSAKPLGAYELIDRLAATGNRIAPMQMYCVLGQLKDAGLILRVESQNAFIAAQHVHRPDEPLALLVCACCGRVDEAKADFLTPALTPTANALGFKPQRSSLEVIGECGACRELPD
jgi:Fur family transcriptional regulator, zinc uptake regulator